jgi:thioredoxin 1
MIRPIFIAGIFFFFVSGTVFAQQEDSTFIKQPMPVDTCVSLKTELVKEMSRRTFIKEVYDYRRKSTPWHFKGNKPAVIVLYASWCSPCKQMTPIIAQLANEYVDKVRFYKVNIDIEKELSLYFQADYIPLFILIPLNEEPQKFCGSMSKDSLKEKIEAILSLEK